MDKKDKIEKSDFKSRLRELPPGTHLCSIYRNKDDQLSAAIAYIVYGLQHNERCLYVTGENSKEEICERLKAEGINPQDHIGSRQLLLLTPRETYLKEDFFSCLRMLDMIENAHYEALRDGFSALRGTGEMNWALDKPPGSGRLMEYESLLNQAIARRRVVALCQYNETLFPQQTMLQALYTHPKVILYGSLYENRHYIPTKEFADRINESYVPGSYEKLRDSILEPTTYGTSIGE